MAHQGRGRGRVLGIGVASGLAAVALMWCNPPKTYDVQTQPSSGTAIEIPRYEPIEMPSSGGCTPTVSRDFQAELEAFNRHIDPYFCSDKALFSLEHTDFGENDFGRRGLTWTYHFSDPDFDVDAYLNGGLEPDPNNSFNRLPTMGFYEKVLEQASTGKLNVDRAVTILDDFDSCRGIFDCSERFPLLGHPDEHDYFKTDRETYPTLEELGLNILGFLHEDMSQREATETFNELVASGDYDALDILAEVDRLWENPYAGALLPSTQGLRPDLRDSENIEADLRAYLGVSMDYARATDPDSPCAIDVGFSLQISETRSALRRSFLDIVQLSETTPSCVPDLVTDLTMVEHYGHYSVGPLAGSYAHFLAHAYENATGIDLSNLVSKDYFDDRHKIIIHSREYQIYKSGVSIVSALDGEDALEHKLRSLLSGPLTPEQIEEVLTLQQLGFGGCFGMLLDAAVDPEEGHPHLKGRALEPIPFHP